MGVESASQGGALTRQLSIYSSPSCRGSDVAPRAAAPSRRVEATATRRTPAATATSRGLHPSTDHAACTACTGDEAPAAAATHATAGGRATTAVAAAAATAIGPAAAAAHLGLLARCGRGVPASGGCGVRRLVAAARARVAGAAATLTRKVAQSPTVAASVTYGCSMHYLPAAGAAARLLVGA